MTRARWVRGGGPVFVGAVAVAVTLTGCSGGGGASDGPSSGPSSTASGNPAISASAALKPSPAPSGFLPVDSLGASEIPWDEVGPGWFLVDWAEHDAVWGEDANGNPTVSPADASVSLLSPDGTWYAAASLAATGSDKTVGWLGDTVAILRTTEPEFSISYGDASALDLRTGASRKLVSGVDSVAWRVFLAGGILTSTGLADEESAAVSWYDASLTEHSVCVRVLRNSVAPDAKRVACLGFDDNAGTGDDQTEILVGTLGSGAEAQVVDTFRLDPYQYELAGWLDGDTFVVARAAQPGETKGTTYYSYNIVTRKVADFALPFPASAPTAWDVSFDWATQTYADMGDDGLSFFAADGAPIVEVPCAGGSMWPGAVYSGTVALVKCDTSANSGSGNVTITLVDLQNGTAKQVADAPIDSEHSVRAVYPYTGNLD